MTSHTIWTTNGRYVSGAPCRALKLSFSASRYRTRLVTSTSCSVHAWGEVARLRTMCSAIDLRMTLSFTSSSRAPSTRAGATAGGAACLVGASGAAVAVPPLTAASTSSRVTRPPSPEPRRVAGSMPCSPASLRTAGESRACSVPPSAFCLWGAGCGARPPDGSGGTSTCAAPASRSLAGAEAPLEAGAVAGAATPVSIWAMTAPTWTVSPAVTAILSSLPSNGEGISALTLSVTTSPSGSSRLTKSPSALSHLSTVPSVTDSPSWGILIWARPMRIYSSRCGANSGSACKPSVARGLFVQVRPLNDGQGAVEAVVGLTQSLVALLISREHPIPDVGLQRTRIPDCDRHPLGLAPVVFAISDECRDVVQLGCAAQKLDCLYRLCGGFQSHLH